MKKLFFFHNSKCGGTSIIDAINRDCRESTFAPLIENNTSDHRRLGGYYSLYKGFDIYTGHYGRDVYEQVTDGHAYLSNFRHPVSRIISLYNFFRSLEMSPDVLSLSHHLAVRIAKTHPIHDFVEHDSDEVQIYIQDAHFRQLTSSFYVLTRHARLTDALKFIDGMVCVYVAEYPDLSLRLFQEKTRITDIPRLNVSRSNSVMEKDRVDSCLYKSIVARNELDLALHDYAISILKRQA